MAYEYNWRNNEANFGPVIPDQVKSGTHITFEIILKKDEKYIALRWPNGIPEHELPPQAKDHPNGLLYFCHGLIRYGESVEECVTRIVKSQAGVGTKSYKVIDIESEVQEKDGQWSFMPIVIAELESLPKLNAEITEVISFDITSVPSDFAWWTKEELTEFLSKL